MSPAQHNATRSVFGQWRYKQTGSISGKIDWSQISSEEIARLSEAMFDAANVPLSNREAYYDAFSKYIQGLGNG